MKPPPKKPGRPAPSVNATLVSSLAAIGATHNEIADFLHVSKRTLEYWLADEKTLHEVRSKKTGVVEHLTLRAIMDRGYARMRISIRREQIKLLQAGNATMAVWLGKQVLGQKDKIEQTIKDPEGGAVRITLEELLKLYRRDS